MDINNLKKSIRFTARKQKINIDTYFIYKFLKRLENWKRLHKIEKNYIFDNLITELC